MGWRTVFFHDPDSVVGDICCLFAESLLPVYSVNNTPIALMEGFFPTLNGCDGVADLNPLPTPPSPWIQVGETVSHFADISELILGSRHVPKPDQ